MQLQQFPQVSYGVPMEIMALLCTNLNGGSRMTTPILGPDGSPINSKAAILLDSSGVPFDPSNVVTPSAFGNYGKADDGDIVQAALNSGKVVFWDRLYNVATPLTAGLGTNTVNSTINGICAFGRTGGQGFDEVGPRVETSGVKWVGQTGATVLTVNGPLCGTNFERFTIDCNGVAGVNAIQSNHMMMSTWHDLTTLRCAGVAYNFNSYAARSGLVQGANKNFFFRVRNVEPASGGSAMQIGNTSGYVNQAIDVAQNDFYGCQLFRDGLNANTFSLNLCFTDNDSFYDCAIWDEGAAGSLVGNSCWISPPSGTGNWARFPASIYMQSCPVRTGFKIDPNWNPIVGMFLASYPTGDGEPIPVSSHIFGYDFTGRWFGPRVQALQSSQTLSVNRDFAITFVDNTHVMLSLRGDDGNTKTYTIGPFA